MIGILNCDLDKNKETNGAYIFNRLIPESRILNIITGEKPSLDYDGYIITGSRASYDEEVEWLEELRNFLLLLQEHDKPCLGICFGMQVIADVFGGRLEKGAVNEEGFFMIELEKHRLFEGLDNKFPIYESHHDVLREVPEEATVIARNENCIQGFVLGNFYGLQFHPEINAEIALEMARRDAIPETQILQGMEPDYNEPEQIIKNFKNLC